MASSHDTVSEALRSTLAAITGTSYVYPPDAVRRTLYWPDGAALDPTCETLYYVRPMGKVTRPYDGRRLERRQEYRILCCHRYTGPTDNPLLEEEPTREQIAADMEADVTRAIWSDVRLGRPDVVIDCMPEPWGTDFDWYVARWVVVELRIVVRYQHSQDDR